MKFCVEVSYGPGVVMVPLYPCWGLLDPSIVSDCYLPSLPELWSWSTLCAPVQAWWFLICIATETLLYMLIWDWLEPILGGVRLVYSPFSVWYDTPSPGSVPILLKMSWYSFKIYSVVMGKLCFSAFMSTAPSSGCFPGNFRSCPLLLVFLCLGAFATMAFKCECVLGGCLSFGGVIFGKHLLCYVTTKNKVPSCVCDLENSFLWCLTSSEEHCCSWPLVSYWGVTIPADEYCRRLWSSIPWTAIYRCTGAWCCTLLLSQPCSQTCKPDHCVVWTSIVAKYACCPLACWGCSLTLSTVSCISFLWRSVVVCYTWLLCPCFSCCSYLQLMDSCWFLNFFTSLVLPILFHPLTCSYLWSVPSSHTYSILHLWWGSPSSGVLTLPHSNSRTCEYDFCLLQMFLSCCIFTLPGVVYLVLDCGGCCSGGTQGLHYTELPIWILYFWSYFSYISGCQLMPNFERLLVYLLGPQL